MKYDPHFHRIFIRPNFLLSNDVTNTNSHKNKPHLLEETCRIALICTGGFYADKEKSLGEFVHTVIYTESNIHYNILIHNEKPETKPSQHSALKYNHIQTHNSYICRVLFWGSGFVPHSRDGKNVDRVVVGRFVIVHISECLNPSYRKKGLLIGDKDIWKSPAIKSVFWHSLRESSIRTLEIIIRWGVSKC